MHSVDLFPQLIPYFRTTPFICHIYDRIIQQADIYMFVDSLRPQPHHTLITNKRSFVSGAPVITYLTRNRRKEPTKVHPGTQQAHKYVMYP